MFNVSAAIMVLSEVIADVSVGGKHYGRGGASHNTRITDRRVHYSEFFRLSPRTVATSKSLTRRGNRIIDRNTEFPAFTSPPPKIDRFRHTFRPVERLLPDDATAFE